MMDDFDSIEHKYGEMFRQLANIVNQQPAADRERTRRLLGEYLHDIKNTLGLITSANAIVERKVNADRGSFDGQDMLLISNTASMKINRYIDLFNNNFASKIDAELSD